MKNRIFLKNAVILTVTSLILRSLGIVFRIWLAGVVGAEGMGLYQLVLSVYVLATAFAGAGICTAVTRLVAECAAKGYTSPKIMRRAVEMSLIISGLTVGIVLTLAKPISIYLLHDTRAITAIKLAAIGVPFMGLCSCFRGYFIALKQTMGPGIGQILEQVVRIAVILPIVTVVAPYGITLTVAAIIFGDGLAEAAGCILMYILYRRQKRKQNLPNVTGLAVGRQMLHIAVPITAGRYMNSSLRTAENMLVPRGLSLFYNSSETGLEWFGMLKGMALPLVFFPASFLVALSTLLIPEISAAAKTQGRLRVRSSVEKSVGITVIISVLISAVFLMCGQEISDLLYDEKDIGRLVTALAPLVPFMYLECVCDGILKGLDQQNSSFLYGLIDSSTRILAIILLLPIWGMRGFLLIMIYSNLLTSLLNIRRLLKVTKTPVNWGSWILKPVIAALLGLGVGRLAMSALSGGVMPLVGGVASLAAVYLLVMFFSGELKIAENLFN